MDLHRGGGRLWRERAHRGEVGAALSRRWCGGARGCLVATGRAASSNTAGRSGLDSPAAAAARTAGLGDWSGAAHSAIDGGRMAASAWPESAAIPIQRYEWPQPGDLLHVDIKPLGGIDGIGHRIHGDRQRRGRGIGWEYVHVAVDDHSRAAYVEVLATQLGPACAAFLRRALAWFATRGVASRRVMTDNGSNYLSRVFRTTCEELGLRHLRTRVYTPRTNGKAERFIQTLLREWAYAEPYESSRERRAKLRPYLRFYNRQRPHSSLDYQAPWSRLVSAA